MHRVLIRPPGSAAGSGPRTFVRLYRANNAHKSMEASGRALRGRTPSIGRVGTNRALLARGKHTGKDAHVHRRRHSVHRSSESATKASSDAVSSEAAASEATLLEAEAAASTAAKGAAASGELPPTGRQLLMHALRSAVPMIGECGWCILFQQLQSTLPFSSINVSLRLLQMMILCNQDSASWTTRS